MTTMTDTRTAWQSNTGCIHWTLECTGLDILRDRGKDPAEELSAVPYTDPLELAKVDGEESTLCRLCALEPVAVAALAVPGERTRFVTFDTRRPIRQVVARRGGSRWPNADPQRALQLAEEGAARVARIAAAGDLHVTRGARSDALYGFVTPAAADVLRRILLLEARDTVTELPSAEQVSMFWSLLLDPAKRPTGVELVRLVSSRPDVENWTDVLDALRDPSHAADAELTDPWFIAEMICDQA